MAQIEVSPEVNKVIKDMAEKRGCKADEAAEYLITKGVQKWNAEHKWIATHAKAAKGTKAKAPKKAKAKGPIARKGGGGKKAVEASASA